MICKNCNSEVGSANYCPNCGARIGGRFCTSCGSAIPAGAHNCPNCGKAVRKAPETSQEQNKGKRKKEFGDRRTGFQSFICLICGVVGLVALGIAIYNFLMGNLFVAQVQSGGTQVINPFGDPITGEGMFVESFALVSSIDKIIAWGQNIVTTITNLFAGDTMAGLSQLLLVYVPYLLIILTLAFAILATAIGTVIAVFRFLGGMFSKKMFNLSRTLGWTFGSNLSIYLACIFAGTVEWVSPSSGIFMNVMLSGLALGVSVLGNVMFAGKRFFKAGSIMKFLSNAGILAGGIITLISFPMAIVDTGDVSVTINQPLLLVTQFIVSEGELVMPDFAYLAGLLALTITFIFTLPGFISKTSSRLATTFKFDGYEDKGFLRKSFAHFFSMLTFLVLTILYLSESGVAINPGIYVLFAGGIITLVSGILNRVFLNKDQK
ncbi:MAG: hypothetical protein IJX05_05540 [Clostridia bacterium]|nr:hypothetical protein [Clostridia bacterium]